MRRVIKIQHFSGLLVYFTDRDPFLQPQKVMNTLEKGSDLAGTSYPPPKRWITVPSVTGLIILYHL